MIIKLLILYENKLINNKFLLQKTNNKIIIKSVDCNDDTIKVIVYNIYNGINYVPINFPLEMPIYEDKVFNPYIIYSSFNLKNDNDLDFFYLIEKKLIEKYNLSLFNFFELIENNLFIKIFNDNYKNNINMEITKIQFTENSESIINYSENTDNYSLISDDIKINKNKSKLSIITSSLWLNLTVIKLYIIYILLLFPSLSQKNFKEIILKYQIPKNILSYANNIRLYKYNLFTEDNSNDNNMLTFNEYMNIDFTKSINLPEIKLNRYYYILLNTKNKSEQSFELTENKGNPEKVIKVFVYKINKNIIKIGDKRNIIFDNYEWYYYHPSLIINKKSILFQTFLNCSINSEIIKIILNLTENHSNRIINYYDNDKKISNLISLSTISEEFKIYFSDFYILKTNSFSDGFFEYMTKKYNNKDNININILEILFSNYNYPLKSNRHDIDNTFDYILYFSLYNHNLLFSDMNIINPEIINIIPIKLKNLYINLLKTFKQIINDEYESITYNQKFYNDYLHRNIIKIFLSNSNKMSINLFKTLVKPQNYEKFRNIFSTNILLIDISNKLLWSNLPKKLNYLNFFYKNNNIVFFQDKINKNIIPDNFDIRIKKVIENPFEMYKYMKKEKDFIKWSKYISDKIIQLYYIPISLSSEDFEIIGKMIYLLFNITEQNLKEQSYMNFINFCNTHQKIIIDSNRINIKIKELFHNLKCNINLGFLAKHITYENEPITFDDNKEINQQQIDIIALELKLQETTKKYHKYKAKYLESAGISKKDSNTELTKI
jgi:hypothetical protein